MAKILLVEDDLPLVRMYQIVLQKAGFEFESALDGEEGLKIAKDQKPDLILLDLVMPKLDGFGVLKEIKAMPSLSKIPIICLSVLHQEEDIKKCKDLGASDYLVKTDVSSDEIIDKIKSFLES